MYISAREKQILDILLNKTNSVVTIKEIASSLGYSTRTIYRDLQGLEHLLKKFDLGIKKQMGKGIKVYGSSKAKKNLKSAITSVSNMEMTTLERRVLILGQLLNASEPIKLISFANDFDVTMATISNDLTELEEWVKSFRLNLVRKQNYGIQITGFENSRRQAMSALIKQNFNETKLFSIFKQNLHDNSKHYVSTVSERLLGMISEERIKFIEHTLNDVIHGLPYSIADSSYIGLVVHLALAMERIEQGEKIEFDSKYLEEIKVTPEYETALKIANQLGSDIPETEVGYITIHLLGAKLRNDKDILVEEPDMNLASKVTALIKHIDHKLNTSLIDDRFLFQGLMAHLERSIYRIQQQLGIGNPLLGQIRSRYQNLFEIIKQAANDVFDPLTIEEEEIGFLTLHFGSALEHQYESQLKAAIICSSGIGSSKMLASRIESEISEVKQIDNISLFDLSKLDFNNYDLILSTIPLPLDDKDYIIISPLLTEEEAESIRNQIQLNRKDSLKINTIKTTENRMSNYNERIEQSFERLENIAHMSNTITTILHNHYYMQLDSGETTKDALFQIAYSLISKNIISDSKKIVSDLMEREKISGLGIPNTNLVLYHCRSTAVLKPLFSIFSLPNSLTVPAMDQSEIHAKTFLVQLTPQDPDDFTIEVLQYISSLLIDDRESIRVFESENASWIISYLAEKLTQYFYKKNELTQ